VGGFPVGPGRGPLLVALILAPGDGSADGLLLPYSRQPDPAPAWPDLFLAGVGTRPAIHFYHLYSERRLSIFWPGDHYHATALLTLWIGYRLLGIPMGLLSGMLAGLQTQRPCWDLPWSRAAMICRISAMPRSIRCDDYQILCAQLLLALLL